MLHMEAKSVTAQVGNQNITIETGKMAKQADGSVVLRAGDSVVLVTAVSAKDRKERAWSLLESNPEIRKIGKAAPSSDLQDVCLTRHWLRREFRASRFT